MTIPARHPLSRSLLWLLPCALAACSGGEFEIQNIHEVEGTLRAGAPTRLRFGFDREKAKRPQSSDADLVSMLEWTVPTGWEQLPAASLRMINLRKGDVECYATKLSGGTAALNINRWRGQLGLEPLDSDGIAALQTAKLLGRGAYRFDGTGAFRGAKGTRLIAVYVQFPAWSMSVKCVGPKAAVAAVETEFDEFCASLGFKRGGAKPRQQSGDRGSGGDGFANEGVDPKKLGSKVPSGWTIGSGSSMRHVTYRTGKDSECWVTFLAPSVGGGDWKANVNRWVGLVGAPMLGDAALAALQKIDLLGSTAPLLEVYGERKAMLAVMAVQPQRIMFVRLSGAKSEVAAQKANFIAYCQSLRIEK